MSDEIEIDLSQGQKHARTITELDFSETVLYKGRRVVHDKKVWRDPEFDGVWHVQGNGEKPYRLQVGEGWMTCTCMHGATSGRGAPHCYHAASVFVSEGLL